MKQTATYVFLFRDDLVTKECRLSTVLEEGIIGPSWSNAVEVCWRLKRLGRAFLWHSGEGKPRLRRLLLVSCFSFFHPAPGTFEFNSKAFRSRSPSAVAQLGPGDLRMDAVTQAVVAASDDLFLADDFTNAMMRLAL